MLSRTIHATKIGSTHLEFDVNPGGLWRRLFASWYERRFRHWHAGILFVKRPNYIVGEFVFPIRKPEQIVDLLKENGCRFT